MDMFDGFVFLEEKKKSLIPILCQYDFSLRLDSSILNNIMAEKSRRSGKLLGVELRNGREYRMGPQNHIYT